jgi:transposase-like protein
MTRLALNPSVSHGDETGSLRFHFSYPEPVRKIIYTTNAI